MVPSVTCGIIYLSFKTAKKKKKMPTYTYMAKDGMCPLDGRGKKKLTLTLIYVNLKKNQQA